MLGQVLGEFVVVIGRLYGKVVVVGIEDDPLRVGASRQGPDGPDASEPV